MHVDLVQDGLGATDEPDPDPGGEDFGQTVESDHTSDFRELALKGEIRPGAGGLSEVEVVVGVIWRESRLNRVDGDE